MAIILKIILINALATILLQDIKERKVFWFLFPVVGISSGILFFLETLPELFMVHITLNLCIVCTTLILIYIYTKIKLKLYFSYAIGLGDILFFIAVAFSFASISFIVLFPFALLFSLVLHLVVSKSKTTTVPLAGYMSLFYGIVFLGSWSGYFTSIYIM